MKILMKYIFSNKLQQKNKVFHNFNMIQILKIKIMKT